MFKHKTITHHADGTISVSDPRALKEAMDHAILVAKENASFFISSAGLDTATQQNAAFGIYSPERCEAIKSYIAACRNEYLRCKALILAATTNDEADAVQFVAPAVPENL